MTLETLRSGLGERGIACGFTENGTAIAAETARLLACDAAIIPAVLGSSSEPLDIGRATRSIPTGIGRALVLRDKQCAFPGCDRKARWTDAHHIQHWADGGPTALDNLVLLCRHHHHVIHHDDWTVAIEHGQPRFSAPGLSAPPGRRAPPAA